MEEVLLNCLFVINVGCMMMTNQLIAEFTGNLFPHSLGHPYRCNNFKEYFIANSIEDVEYYINMWNETNCFISVFPYTEYSQETRNKFSAIINTIPLDFDDTECPANCLEDVKKLLIWADRHNIHPRISFSGNKGLHVFLDIKPIKLNHPQETLRKFTTELNKAAGFKTLDLSIAGDLERIIRIPNTKHPKSGLYCIPLNNKLIPYLSMEDIQTLAQRKQTYVPVRCENDAEIHALLEEYDVIVEDEIEEMKLKIQAIEEAEKNGLFPGLSAGIPCPAYRRCINEGSDEGTRSYCAAGIAQKCKKDGWTLDKAFNIMKDFGEKCDPKMNESELKKILQYQWKRDYSICTFFSKGCLECTVCPNRTF